MSTRLNPVKRGDTIVLDITVTTAAGAAQDLAGCTLYATLKDDLSDTDANAISQVTTTGGGIVVDSPTTLGTATATFPASATLGLTQSTTLYWDVQLKDATGQIFTVADGTIPVQLDVTITTA